MAKTMWVVLAVALFVAPAVWAAEGAGDFMPKDGTVSLDGGGADAMPKDGEAKCDGGGGGW